MTSIQDIYTISVTMDNIGEFAAKAEKIGFLNLKCNTISIAVDDLIVYQNYFDSPLKFLHFLKQRRTATENKTLALNDELDHLGMYIHHNCYALPDDVSKKPTVKFFLGYREDLDTYFCQLYHPELNPQKPVQTLQSTLSKCWNGSTLQLCTIKLEFRTISWTFHPRQKKI